MSQLKVSASSTVNAGVSASRDGVNGAGADGHYVIECVDANGAVKWTEDITNIIVNEGLNYLAGSSIGQVAKTTSWYLGLTDGTPTVSAAHTMASHSGWVEVTAYSEGSRPTFTPGAVSSQTVDNVGNEALFSINADSTTVGGAFMVSVNSKGGSTGTLFSGGAFSGGDKAVDSGDTLNVTYSLTTSDV